MLDVPHTRADGPVNGIEVSEWGCHDRHFGLRGSPAGIVEELTARHGLHPVLGIDASPTVTSRPTTSSRARDLRTPAEDRQLTEGLLAGIETKRRLALEVLEREPWDFYFCVFGEGHAAGHHLWHHHDRRASASRPGGAAELGDPLVRIYEALDVAVAEHLERCGPETTFVLLLSHGMRTTTTPPTCSRRCCGASTSSSARACGDAARREPPSARSSASRRPRRARAPAGGRPGAQGRPPARAASPGGASTPTTTGPGSAGSSPPTTPSTAACGSTSAAARRRGRSSPGAEFDRACERSRRTCSSSSTSTPANPWSTP